MFIQKWNLGKSVQSKNLELNLFTSTPSEPKTIPKPWILFLGAVHGDEIEGVWLLEAVIEKWSRQFPQNSIAAGVWPQVNPDGVALGQRWNANQIDLNRNLPSQDWTPEIKNPRYPPGPKAASEPENQALVKLIQEEKPTAILSVHSFHRFQVNINGPSKEWGERLSQLCGYPITEDIGYPTPGCLGTYAGKELGIPAITLEIERGIPKEKVLEIHLPVVEETLKFWSKAKQ